jgi:hypothetical protein
MPLEASLAPIIEDCWGRAKFAFETMPKLRELGVAGVAPLAEP